MRGPDSTEQQQQSASSSHERPGRGRQEDEDLARTFAELLQRVGRRIPPLEPPTDEFLTVARSYARSAARLATPAQGRPLEHAKRWHLPELNRAAAHNGRPHHDKQD